VVSAILLACRKVLPLWGANLEYRPDPIDTAGVVLDEDIKRVAEFLARNTHAVWAQERLAEGWRYGTKRDDVRKEHPCLVPYEELPESEKEYDRRTAIQVMKALVAMGYTITRSNSTEPES
jgi:predicted CoA-binding protein